MFCRYFGQSIGAALLAVIFNKVIANKMELAPDNILAELPSVNKVVDVLQSKASSSELVLFLRDAFFEATHSVYVALTVVAVITLIILLLTPARFGRIR